MRAEGMVLRKRGLWAALDWLVKVRVAGVEAMAAGLGITARQARRYAKTLEEERLLVRNRLGDGGGSIVAVTPRGQRWAGYPITSRTTTRSLAGLLHGRGVSWVAAHCERNNRPWVGPGELRAEGWTFPMPPGHGAGALTHMPDLGFILEGTERWAVEFERVPKSRARLARILDGYRSAELRGDLDAVLYVCGNESICRLVDQVAEEVEVDRAIRTLDWVIKELTGP